MAVKVKEDPLFLIKKKEEEARKQLISNPVKMKQLQQVQGLGSSSACDPYSDTLIPMQLLAEDNFSKRKSKKRKKDRSRSPHRYTSYRNISSPSKSTTQALITNHSLPLPYYKVRENKALIYLG